MICLLVFLNCLSQEDHRGGSFREGLRTELNGASSPERQALGREAGLVEQGPGGRRARRQRSLTCRIPVHFSDKTGLGDGENVFVLLCV